MRADKQELLAIVQEGAEYMSSIIQAIESSGKADEVLLARAFAHLMEMQIKLEEALDKPP